MSRTFAIGDIHGALPALNELMEHIQPRQSDHLIFLGDYVDRHPQSSGVISKLISLAALHNCIFIKGNHDAWYEEWITGGTADPQWLEHGGLQTVLSYEGVDGRTKAAHTAFVTSLKGYYLDRENRLFLHAGFSSMHGVAHEHYPMNFYWDRTLWETALAAAAAGLKPGNSRYPTRLRHYPEIFIGHTPTLNYGISVPMQCCNVWNVDTGAGFSGKLSAIDVDTKEVFQSRAVSEFYR